MMDTRNDMTPVTCGELARRCRRELAPAYGAGEADAMTSLIFHSLKGWDRTAMVVNSDFPASEWLIGKVGEILERLERHEPIQYILGEARFHGMDLKVTPDTLIPRPETAELVDMITDREGDTPDLRVLDVGTGSGAIAIALARNLRFPEVTAIDISAGALAVAAENARRLHADIRLMRRDVFTWTPDADSFDIIVSNPPYIAREERDSMEANVREHEPEGALFVPDSDPLLFYRRIAVIGRDALVRGGRVYFEINPRFDDALAELMGRGGYREVELHRDSYGKTRFLTAVR